jgi:hypothetical protein
MSTTGIISLSSMDCFPGLRDSAFGIAGAVVALTLGASIVALKWVVVVDVMVPELLLAIAEIIDDPESTRFAFVVTGRPLKRLETNVV